MSIHRAKKDASLRDRLSRQQPRNATQETAHLESQKSLRRRPLALSGKNTEGSLTHTYMASLFSGIQEDIGELRNDVTTEIKEVKRDMAELGHWVNTMEQSRNAKEKELNTFRWEQLEH
ncbi:hypothetical protein NDU88_003680 [Pleurodeles waltl]|uniref:Uncharacterized protein n=1 Tax=Pleurodeles waltl TaxID=8319 RepID=A0AAV7RFZ0_PLEWA|nr:hypothetical protein NDU88_003680 [Pleurodeles waltl]